MNLRCSNNRESKRIKSRKKNSWPASTLTTAKRKESSQREIPTEVTAYRPKAPELISTLDSKKYKWWETDPQEIMTKMHLPETHPKTAEPLDTRIMPLQGSHLPAVTFQTMESLHLPLSLPNNLVEATLKPLSWAKNSIS